MIVFCKKQRRIAESLSVGAQIIAMIDADPAVLNRNGLSAIDPEIPRPVIRFQVVAVIILSDWKIQLLLRAGNISIQKPIKGAMNKIIQLIPAGVAANIQHNKISGHASTSHFAAVYPKTNGNSYQLHSHNF